jgi:hypothetical protein
VYISPTAERVARDGHCARALHLARHDVFFSRQGVQRGFVEGEGERGRARRGVRQPFGKREVLLGVVEVGPSLNGACPPPLRYSERKNPFTVSGYNAASLDFM